jgi:hypothetical protein
MAQDSGFLQKEQRRAGSVLSPTGSWFDTSNRDLVRYLYGTMLATSRTVAVGWTGSIAGCSAGTISIAYQDAVRTRVNWFRAMAGVPAGTILDGVFNAKDQQAALMVSANRQLSHFPPSSWDCYTSDGAEAASRSNLCYWWAYSTWDDPGCVELYVRDHGASNAPVGHRRWLLYPPTDRMGTGDVSETNSGSQSYPGGNALWVLPSTWPPRPATREEFVAWPPPGYVPYDQVYPRWSFSYPGADFSMASVSMSEGGQPLPVRLETPANGYGENTLVWVANNLDPDDFGAGWPRPNGDRPINVTVSNVLIGGQQRDFSYQVTIIDPETGPALADSLVAAFRDQWDNVRIALYPSSQISSPGGVFADRPGIGMSWTGRAVVAARDTFNALWANVFDVSSGTGASWSYGGGIIKGVPAVAVGSDGKAYIATRDNWNSYWIVRYTSGAGFGSWEYLAGIFSTDPVIAACPDGSLYIIGKDNWNSLWSGRYVPGTGFQGWRWGQGIVAGRPAVTCGTDSAAYVAVRDSWNSVWMARVVGDTWTGWHYGGGIISDDPQVVSDAGGMIYVVVQDSWGGIWWRGFVQGPGIEWRDWVFSGGILKDFSAGRHARKLSIVGRDGGNGLWWYRVSAGWTPSGVAAGPLTAVPR